jgi:hypothetical protein
MHFTCISGPTHFDWDVRDNANMAQIWVQFALARTARVVHTFPPLPLSVDCYFTRQFFRLAAGGFGGLFGS